MTAAAFQACFTDWRLIKGRKCVQIVLEVPVEAADEAYQALGGMPDPSKSVWCAVARLNMEAKEVVPIAAAEETTAPQRQRQSETRPAPAHPHPTQQARAKQSWHDMSPAQQAGILCSEEAFWSFLTEKHTCQIPITSSDAAAQLVREIFGVKSRTELPLIKWRNFVRDYHAWMCEPEVVG